MQHQLEIKLTKWKEKAQFRRKELYRLSRQHNGLLSRHQLLRKKYQVLKRKHARLEKGLQTGVPVENQILSAQSSDEKARIFSHKYLCWIVYLCLEIRLSGLSSLRGTRQILSVFYQQFNLEGPLPCHSSIRNWELKSGYDRLELQDWEDRKWALIFDESMCIGQESLLLLLGVDLSQYSFGEALCFSDAVVLGMRIRSSWKADEIQAYIASLQAKGLQIEYIISDGGNNLVKCSRELGITRIEDVTHALNKLIEKRFKDDEAFKDFSKESAAFKRKISMSKQAAYIPPTQRSKGRYLNLSSLAKWGKNILIMRKEADFNTRSGLGEKLDWIQNYQALIIELDEACQGANKLFTILKHQGLSQKSKDDCLALLKRLSLPTWFDQGVKEYLERNIEKELPYQTRICCSDLIESFFGKYKQQIQRGAVGGITESVLSIANYPKLPEKKYIKQAFERTKIKDIINWRDQNCKETIGRKRKKLFENIA